MQRLASQPSSFPLTTSSAFERLPLRAVQPFDVVQSQAQKKLAEGKGKNRNTNEQAAKFDIYLYRDQIQDGFEQFKREGERERDGPMR